MSNFARTLLSGSPANGRAIPVVAVASPGTLLHTAVAGQAAYDEIFLWANNVTNNSVALTIEWGGTTTGDQIAHTYTIPPNSPPILIVPGITLNGGLVVRAFAASANAINIVGHVNTIS